MKMLVKMNLKWMISLLILVTYSPAAITAPSVSSGSADVRAEQSIEQTHTLNFVDADIHGLIVSVSRITGINFIVDPRIKGKVTLISNKEMPSEDVYKFFFLY